MPGILDMATYNGTAVNRGGIYLCIQPGQVGFSHTTVRFRPSWVYRLRDEIVEGRP